MKYCFAYPHGGTVHYGYLESIIQLLMHEWTEKPLDQSLLGSHIEAGSCSVCMNRNKAVNFFMNQTQDDYLFMADTDVVFEKDILDKFDGLIGEYIVKNKVEPWDRKNFPHIVAGRVDIGNGMPVFFKRTAPGDFKHYPIPFKGLKSFDAVGSGLIVISRYVFKTIYDNTKSSNFYMYREEEGKLASDDFSFQFLAEKYGFGCFGAWDIRGLHQKSQPIQPRYFEKLEEYEKYCNENPKAVPEWLKEEYFNKKESK